MPGRTTVARDVCARSCSRISSTARGSCRPAATNGLRRSSAGWIAWRAIASPSARGWRSTARTVTLVLFDVPLAGVEYAVTLHERLAEMGRELGVALSCRAAVHVGEVIVRRNPPEDVARGAKALEIEGLAKPATARLLSLALPLQTLLGRTAYELARRATVGPPAFQRYVWASYGAYRFQGLEEPLDVHEVGLVGRAPLRAPPDSN